MARLTEVSRLLWTQAREFLNIRARDECLLARAGQNQRARPRLDRTAFELVDQSRELYELLEIERIQLVGSVQRNAGDAGVLF
jgi:hypothetical protein